MNPIEISTGRLEGVLEDGIQVFRGIPYARPPVGERRWRAPAPALPWTGVRVADTFSHVAPQTPSPLEQLMGPRPHDAGEDCLYLNVWTPAADAGARPVMVWIHGGAFTRGTGGTLLYDGHRLAARHGVVVVTINYRLGALGFLNLGASTNGRLAACGNEGLLDQRLALKWVQQNIDRFGGDPRNVTIFGESAGGMSVGHQLALDAEPGRDRLIHKAIPQSGACHTALDVERSHAVAEAMLKALEISRRDVDALMNCPAERIVAAQEQVAGYKVSGFGPREIGGMPFQPVVDGRVVKQRPIDLLRDRPECCDRPLLVGSTLEEWKLFGVMDPGVQAYDLNKVRERVGQLVGAGGEALVEGYRDGMPEASAPELFMAIQTDRLFRMPGVRLAEQQASAGGAPAYQYLFDWASPIMDGAFGACHAIELGFVFGTHEDGQLGNFFGTGADARALAERTMAAWTRFAHDGHPGEDWPAYGPGSRISARFGRQDARLDDERGALRELWSGIDDTALGSV